MSSRTSSKDSTTPKKRSSSTKGRRGKKAKADDTEQEDNKEENNNNDNNNNTQEMDVDESLLTSPPSRSNTEGGSSSGKKKTPRRKNSKKNDDNKEEDGGSIIRSSSSKAGEGVDGGELTEKKDSSIQGPIHSQIYNPLLNSKPSDAAFTIMAFNVNGLRAAMKNSLIDVLGAAVNNMTHDIICLSEVKCDESIVNDPMADIHSLLPNAADSIAAKNSIKSFFQPIKTNSKVTAPAPVDSSSSSSLSNSVGEEQKGGGGYYKYWSPCLTDKGYSGTAIFTKIKPLNIYNNFDMDPSKPSEPEGRILIMEFDYFFLIHTYVPNAGQELERLDYRCNQWDEQIRKLLVVLKEKCNNNNNNNNNKNNNNNNNKGIIWMGDLNVAPNDIDIQNAKTNKKSPGFTIEEKESFKKTLELGFIDTYRYFYPTNHSDSYTYFGYRFNARIKNNGWRLDHAIINKEWIHNIEKFWIGNEINKNGTRISDHLPIILQLKSDVAPK